MRIIGIVLVILLVSCKHDASQQEQQDLEVSKDVAALPTLEVYDYEGLKPFLKTTSDSTYIINFWATWCAPCIKELPYFEAINKNYKDRNVSVTLVSLDFPKKYESHLKPYIRDNEIKSRVVVLNDSDSNTWIPAIDPDWSGAIPATLIYNKNKRAFYEQPFTYEELETELQKFLN